MPKSISRGLTEEECLKLLNTLSDHPLKDPKESTQRNRDTALIRMLYEGFPRVSELLKAELRDLDFRNDALFIRWAKSHYDRKLGKVIQGKQRHIYFSPTTHNALMLYLGRGRLRSNRQERIFSIGYRQVENIVTKWATLAKIQDYEDHGERSYALVTPRKLREAGERHTDLGGADLDVTAEVAGHSVETKRKYYKKVSFEEARDQIRKHHPAFK